jgi:hypothetical protein
VQFERGLAALKAIVVQLQGHGVLPGEHATSLLEESLQAQGYLPAFEAEGLLGVAITIIKQLPPGFLLPQWPLYFRTFKSYLGHPASTVRQAASLVFKHIVARDASNAVIAKLVLQGLAAYWPVDAAALLGKQAEAPTAPQLTWQAQEGRLMAYELIFKFLITNHTHYLFPSSLLQAQSDSAGSNALIPLATLRPSKLLQAQLSTGRSSARHTRLVLPPMPSCP